MHIKGECRESGKKAMGSTDNQSHQLAFEGKNEQLTVNGGNFLLPSRNQGAAALGPSKFFRMQYLFEEMKEDQDAWMLLMAGFILGIRRN